MISQEQEQEVRDEKIFCVLDDRNLVNLRGYRELEVLQKLLRKIPEKFVSIKTI